MSDKAIAQMKGMAQFGFHIVIEGLYIASYTYPPIKTVSDYAICPQLTDAVGVNIYVGRITD